VFVKVHTVPQLVAAFMSLCFTLLFACDAVERTAVVTAAQHSYRWPSRPLRFAADVYFLLFLIFRHLILDVTWPSSPKCATCSMVVQICKIG